MRHATETSGFGRPRPEPETPVFAGVRPALFYTLVGLLLGTNVLTLVGLMMSPDIAALLDGRNAATTGAYEDRIAQLRVEVDRLHSRQYAQAGDINLQLQELSAQQEMLTEQHQYVKVLAEKAAELGIETAALPPTAAAPVPPTGAVTATTGDIAAANQSVQQMMGETRAAMQAISTAATDSTEKIVTGLRGIGIAPALPSLDEAAGGPLLPERDDLTDVGDMLDDANAVMAALVRFKAARGALEKAPVHMPIAGDIRLSSGFGNRRDPFTRGRAFHSGLDFPKPTGTIVLSAGSGIVSFVGQRSGYGNVVEVDHGNGIVTRYAHLSAFIAAKGQPVRTGSPIAQVGSTGRSTGPHLHFEVRRNDQALNPLTFLNAGKKLLGILAT